MSMIFFGLVSGANGGIIISYTFASVLLIIWPIFTIYFLLKNKDKTKDDEFKAKFSTMYQGIRTDSFKALCYTAVFSVRRFDLVIMNHFFTVGSPLSGIDRNFYLHKILTFLFI